MTASDQLDGYLAAPRLRQLVYRLALEPIDAAGANVTLRIPELPTALRGRSVAPEGAVAVDLLDSVDQRTVRAGNELAESARGWTLIGARMVQLHAAERGRVVPRVSFGADALADTRDRNETERISRALARHGFDLDEPSPFGVGHVFRRGSLEIDVLAPDGVKAKARHVTALGQDACRDRICSAPSSSGRASRSRRCA